MFHFLADWILFVLLTIVKTREWKAKSLNEKARRSGGSYQPVSGDVKVVATKILMLKRLVFLVYSDPLVFAR
jgi:hypothetical protein